MFKKYIGNKAFYKSILVLMIPIMVQNGITNFVSMLDNIMVGRIGTVEMTAVAVANQLIFVFNLCVFGAVSGAGIFGAQFFGKNDIEGVRHTFRFKIIFCFLFSLAAIGIFALWGGNLTSLYLQGEGSAENAAASLECAKVYMNIMLIGLIPYALVQCYGSTLRETGKAAVPMYAGLVAVIVNLGLNYVLIFGRFGFPAMGAAGAAIATVISRFAELAFVAFWTQKNKVSNPFIIGALSSLKVPGTLVKDITVKGMPLMINEALWAAGTAMLNQCYSVRGLDVVAANNISQTFFNVFSVAFMAVGASIGIILGQTLGAGETEKAKEDSGKLIAFSLFVSVIVASVYFFCAEFIPEMYNTTDEIKYMAMRFMQICAVAMPIDAFANASYFTLRSGGKTLITFLFDSCFVWCIAVPAAFVLSRYTTVPILQLYAICQALNIIKCIIGYIFVKEGMWIRNIVD